MTMSAESGGPTVGVLAKLHGGSFFGGVLTGVVHAAKAVSGRAVIIQTHSSGLTDEETLATPAYARALGDARVDAWIVVSASVPSEHLGFLRSTGKPLALVGASWGDGEWATVVPDN